jgi:O-antigen/teichoic acid export membrane protein
MEGHQQHLRRGFNWLGGATIVAKITDIATILLVLRFLTKEQVGAGSLVVAIGAVIEALDGLGTSTALVQAPSLSRLQLDSLFWFILLSACVVAGVVLLAAPWIASLYGIAGVAAYFLAIAIKQPLVGAAVIPLAMLQRGLRYERIALVNVGSTFAAALTRLGLAMAGAGSWAIVIAFAASGLFTLIGAMLASPFRPQLRMSLSAVSPLLRFGLRATMSGLCEQMINNIHHVLVGWFYGAAALAEFRVSFDLAMEPANAAGTLISRTALPVFARVAAVREHLVQSLAWSLRRLLAVAAPLAAAIALAADPITSMIHDEQHQSYAPASLPLKLLAAAALMRVISQLAYTVMFASGRPQLSVRFSGLTLLLLGAGMLLVGLTVPAPNGLVAMSTVWLVVTPLLLLWQAHYLRRHWDIRVHDVIRALGAPIVAVAMLVLAVQAARHLMGTTSPALQVAVVVALALLTCVGLLLREPPLRDRAARATGDHATIGE